MKMRRSALVLGLGVVGGVVGLMACGEDESNPGPPVPDASTVDVRTSDGSAAVDANRPDTSTPGVDAGRDTGTDASDAGADADADADAGGVFASCNAALGAVPTATSGVYLVDPDGDGVQPATAVYCDMTKDGGAWTLGLLKNSVDNGNYATFGSGYVNVAALATSPEAASVIAPAPAAVAGWLDLNAFAYTELVIEGFSNGASTFRSAIVPKSALRIAFGQNGYLLYNDANGYYWCGGDNNYTDTGVGQINKPAGAPDDCKGHTSLGNGWDFGGATVNTNLTVCGGGSALMKAGPTEPFVTYPSPGAAQAIWVR